MQLSEYKNIYDNESNHFFYKATHHLTLQLVKQFCDPNTRLDILDAGCGTGLLATKLKKFGNVEGIDYHPEAVKFAKKRGIKVIKGSVDRLPYKKSTFDLVICIDVLYHKGVNDIKALHEFYRVLKPNGVLILRVPANKWLTPKHDKLVHTRERYDKSQIENRIIQNRFKIIKISYVHSILLPLTIINQFKENILESNIESTIGKLPEWINFILYWILKIEVNLLKNINIPFGLGLTVVAKKLADEVTSRK